MNHILNYEQPASCFEESLLLGNGHLGAAVYGGTVQERYSLNEGTLWSGYPKAATNPLAQSAYKKAQAAVLKGNPLTADKTVSQNFSGTNSQVYLPLCNLWIESAVAEPTNYNRSLDLSTGLSRVAYSGDNYRIERESFISHPNRVLAIHIKQENVAVTKISFSSLLRQTVTVSENSLILRGVAPTYCYEPGRYYPSGTNKPVYSEKDAEKGMRYKAMLKVVCDGETEIQGTALNILNAKEITLYFATRTSFNGFNKHPYLEGAEFENTCTQDIQSAVFKGYSNLKTEHIQDFLSLYNRTSFSLGSSKTPLPTDRLLTEHQSTALYELLFNLGKYLTVSGSRKGGQPTTLQGLWNELLAPPWNSNYTLNINTEMNYSPTLRLRLPECFEPYERLAKELTLSGRKVAEEWYGIHGSVAHHNTDLWRIAHPVGNQTPGNSVYSFFNTSLGWILLELCEKYILDPNPDYLKNTLYPLISECADTFIELLVPVHENKLAICPATSPENVYITEKEEYCNLAPYTAMNNAICRYILKMAADFSSVLEKTSAAEKYTDYFSRIQSYEIGPDGRILEWDRPYSEREVQHRHVSHLFGLHPAKEITPYATPELAAAAKKSLNTREDGGTGWCIAWKANMWARLFDGDRALQLIDNQLTLVKPTATLNYAAGGGSYPNLLCAHPPFQIDGNFGATAAIIEMLIQANGSDLYILPALPKKWPDGEISGIAIPGGAQISIQWKNGAATKVKITPEEKAKNYRLIYPSET